MKKLLILCFFVFVSSCNNFYGYYNIIIIDTDNKEIKYNNCSLDIEDNTFYPSEISIKIECISKNSISVYYHKINQINKLTIETVKK